MKEATKENKNDVADGHEKKAKSPWQKPRGSANLQSTQKNLDFWGGCRQTKMELGCILEESKNTIITQIILMF